MLIAEEAFSQNSPGGLRSAISIDDNGKNIVNLEWQGGGESTLLQYRSLSHGVMKNVEVDSQRYELSGLPEGGLFE